MNNYIDYNLNTPQYRWRVSYTLPPQKLMLRISCAMWFPDQMAMQQDLHVPAITPMRLPRHICRFVMDMTTNLNRTATPWVIVMTHAPVYVSARDLRLYRPTLTIILLFS